MARQVRLFLFLSLIGAGFWSFAGEPVCSKQWENLPSGTSSKGQIISTARSEDGNSSFLEVYNFDGKLLKKYPTQHRTIDHVYNNEGDGDGIFYSARGLLYHLDPKTGEEQKVGSLNGGSPCFSKSSSLVTKCFSEGAGFVYDMKSKQQIEIPSSKAQAVFGQSIVYGQSKDEEFSKVSIYDFSTSKQTQLDVPKGKYIQAVNSDFIYIGSNDGGMAPASLIKVGNKWVTFENKNNKLYSGKLSNGDILAVSYRHKSGQSRKFNYTNMKEFVYNTEVFDKSGKQKKADLKGAYFRSSNAPIVLQSNFDGESVTGFAEADLPQLTARKKVQPIASGSNISYSDSGRWAVANDHKNNTSKLKDLKTGESIDLNFLGTYPDVIESKNGKKLLVKVMSSGSALVDLESGKVRYFSDKVSFDENFEKWIVRIPSNKKMTDLCQDQRIQVIEDDCDCLFKNADNVPVSENFQNFADLTLATLCQSGFSKSEWDKITPPITKGQISRRQAVLYMKRFQKKDGYDPQLHRSILEGILGSDLVEKSPKLVDETMKTLVSRSPQTAESLSTLYNLSERIPKKYPADTTLVCKGTQEAADDYAQMEVLKREAALGEGGAPSTKDMWEKYRPFKKEISELSAKEKEAIIDGIGEGLSQRAATKLKGVFQSKLYYFSKKYAMDLMGETSKSATDLTLSLQNGRSAPVVLSSGVLEGAVGAVNEDEMLERDPFGFQYKFLDEVTGLEKAKVGSVVEKKYSWVHNGETYSADTKIKILTPLEQMVSKDKSPDYKALKKDGKLTGMMIMAANVTSEAGWVVDSYLTYYQKAGFEFKEAKSVDAISFFKKAVESGEVDYLIKEAHSDGDEKNLFRANSFGRVFEGTLKKEDGTSEVIYLVTPEEGKHDTKLISNQEFGKWIRDRKEGQPLVYFNASCSSTRKVIAEISAVHSKNFTPVASTGLVQNFSSGTHNGTRAVLEAFRGGQDYDGIRASLQKTRNFKENFDKYIFPDEEDYTNHIRKNLNMNVDTEITVRNASGKIQHIDENIDH